MAEEGCIPDGKFQNLDVVNTLTYGSLVGNFSLGSSDLTVQSNLYISSDADVNDSTADSAIGRIAIGADQDINLYHKTNSYLVNKQNNLIITNINSGNDIIIDNQISTGSISNVLGSDTSATEFNIKNNSGTSLFSVKGDGNISLSSISLSSLTMTGDIDLGTNNIINGGTITATTLAGTLSTAAQTNVTSLGTLSSLTMDGNIDLNTNNITNGGTITATTLAGTLSTAAQTNVTSLGTLSSLTMGGNIDLATNNITNGGTITATTLAGTLSTAAQTNVTSLGTLTSLDVDNIRLDGNTISTTSSDLTISPNIKNVFLSGCELDAYAYNATNTNNDNTLRLSSQFITYGGSSYMGISHVDNGDIIFTGSSLDSNLTINNNGIAINNLLPITTDINIKATNLYIKNLSDTTICTIGTSFLTVNGTISATTLTGTLSTAAQTNVTSLGTLSSLTMGGNIDLNTNNITNGGTITATTLAGTLSTAAQTNITSIGSLTSLTTIGKLLVDIPASNYTPSSNGFLAQYEGNAIYTDNSTSSSGTASAAYLYSFNGATLAASNSSVTTTDAATLYINSAPTAGTNMTLTNSWGLLCNAPVCISSSELALSIYTTNTGDNIILDTSALYQTITFKNDGVIIGKFDISSDGFNLKYGNSYGTGTNIYFNEDFRIDSNSNVYMGGQINIFDDNPFILKNGSVVNAFSYTINIDILTANRIITIPDRSLTLNAASDISGTTLASNVVSSSLTSLGTLTGLTMGGNINLGNNNITNGGTITATTLAGTLSTAAQTNITSVGTLSSLTVSGNTTIDTNTFFLNASTNKIGIGNTSPDAKVHITSTLDSTIADCMVLVENQSTGTDGDASIRVLSSNGGEAEIVIGNNITGGSTFNMWHLGMVTDNYNLHFGYESAKASNITDTTIGSTTAVMTLEAANKRLGIGTITPTYKLHVVDDSNSDLIIAEFMNDNANSTAHSKVVIRADGGDPALQFTTTGSTNFLMGIDHSDSDKFKIGSAAANWGTTFFTMDTSGNTLVGTPLGSAYKFAVSSSTGTQFAVDPSDATFLKIGNFYSSSDTFALCSAGNVMIAVNENNSINPQNYKFSITEGGTGTSDLFAVDGLGITTISNTTQSTSTSTGSLITAGGIGCAKDIYCSTIYPNNGISMIWCMIDLNNTNQTTPSSMISLTIDSQSSHNNYSLGTGSNYINVNITGYYLICCSITFQDNTNERSCTVYFRETTTTIRTFNTQVAYLDTSTSYGNGSMQFIHQLNSSSLNIYNFFWESVSGGTADIRGVSETSMISIIKVG